jgi:hypothetical protein
MLNILNLKFKLLIDFVAFLDTGLVQVLFWNDQKLKRSFVNET